MWKKILGWILIISGIGNFITFIAMVGNNVSSVGGQSVGGKLLFSIGLLGLGYWLISSSKKKKNNLPK